MLGLPPATIRSYAARGVLVPGRGPRGGLRFDFKDLIVLRTAGELVAAKVPQRKIRRVLDALRAQLPAERSLTGVRISADGERIVVSDGESRWNPESGQALFDFSVAEVAAKTRQFVARDAAVEWYERGLQLEDISPAEAVASYERALELDPDHADSHVNVGRLLHDQGNAGAAEQHYRRALTLDPTHAIALFNLGVALEDHGRLAEAREAYEHALELDPDDADAHYNLAGILERRGDKAGAVRHLKAFKKLS
jgi:tetratricopeptide (TPR) repeat protein